MNSNKSKLSSDIDFTTWMETLEKEAQAGCLREIAMHKAAGRNIYYSNHGVPTFETPEGKHFEYKLHPNGTDEIIREVKRNINNGKVNGKDNY
ncbi:hypothetical protein NIES4071_09770 [Calothrix sp. NIES-4071]|nr:hypothetical protein NIES4071_09770 [Calothrix sp. NIES-4071]BAZ55319.1 hypothetical protein NIES4105_09730 [Calothrix sp. NIES-4105]